ncbi:unnamed protein product [Mytilus edulis]|uniref:Uncharacterized protein n=1 Tax=Mytilus edulis TaxID=6550 RepID=A0A8S3T0V6_MYTED|nr:unnamed protein product [Mytilus edulis]
MMVSSLGVAHRSAKECKDKWGNTKKEAKKIFSVKKRDHGKTGGGPQAKPVSVAVNRTIDLCKDSASFKGIGGVESCIIGKEACRVKIACQMMPELRELVQQYNRKADSVQNIGSTQANENFNQIVGSKCIKARTQERLITGGKIRLHKIVSNNSEVVKSFETKDLAESITEIDFNSESTCLQRSLGLCWNVVKDSFAYQLTKEEKPFTKSGLLSVVNGIFDPPLGFIAPVIIGVGLIMREAVQNNSLDWDDPLPDNLHSNWQRWKQSLQDLET